MTDAVWFVALERAGARAEWDWLSLGEPDPRELLPTRKPTSGDFSRHIPRTAYSVTNDDMLELESGLEHDLVKWLDLRQDVTWLVAQPVMLHFPIPHRRRAVIHTPDLLAQHADGSVTVWDARATERHDEMFRFKAALADNACRRVGWGYRTFDGLPEATRINLLWLSGYRRRMPWYESRAEDLLNLLDGRELQMSDIVEADDGSGETLSTLWHLIAIGVARCELGEPIDARTVITWSDTPSPGIAIQLPSPKANRLDTLIAASGGEVS